MARKLDRCRPFGEIYGGTGEARFEQDGIQFDAAGVELPGFEAVEIVVAEPVAASGNNDSIREEIVRLQGQVAKLSADLEEKDAKYEEAIGQLDTATIQVTRLQAEVDRLTALLPADNAAAAADVDAQLDLQGATTGTGSKKK